MGMKMLMERDDLWPVVAGDVSEPDAELYARLWDIWSFCDRSAKQHIASYVVPKIKEELVDLNNAKHMCDTLRHKYEVSTAIKSTHSLENATKLVINDCAGFRTTAIRCGL